MEKRSRRRTRDLVTQPASQGLSENEIGCARISIMAKSMNALLTGRIQKRKTNPLRHSHLTCNTRPVHTDGSIPTEVAVFPTVQLPLCPKSHRQRPDAKLFDHALLPVCGQAGFLRDFFALILLARGPRFVLPNLGRDDP
jgi:hypothetical protein